VLHADLTKLESGAPAGVPSFDLIVCNEVLEHVPDPFAATRSLYALLKPGGLVIFTAPFACRQHLGWDFFRYTVSGAAQIFSEAGFKVLIQQRVGNTYLASGFVLGFPRQSSLHIQRPSGRRRDGHKRNRRDSR
jgi:SAM-dependent methyltransferase